MLVSMLGYYLRKVPWQGGTLEEVEFILKMLMEKTKEDFKEYQIALQHMGRPLYEKYGFIKMEDEMELVWCIK